MWYRGQKTTRPNTIVILILMLIVTSTILLRIDRTDRRTDWTYNNVAHAEIRTNLKRIMPQNTIDNRDWT